ncbi:MAG: hypothetical protein V4750_11385 [Pseudomonadota bacterium]
MRTQFIAIHATAPAKPPLGGVCNGCGVCCLAEPCPAGRLLTLQRRGACRLLRWDDAARHYRCGLLAAAPVRGRWSTWLQRGLHRWIAAGVGCDSDATVEPAG